MTGERFTVVYRIRGDEAAAREKAGIICFEQTVELDDAVVTDRRIRDAIVGKIDRFLAVRSDLYEARISYAVETSALELTQLLNVVFGNTSIKAGIRVVHLELCDGIFSKFPGPRFGIDGLRRALGVVGKPLLCTALKPMGKSVREIAELAYRFALGGVDVIKDDHGLTDQPFCPFHPRVEACAEAVEKANRETGKRSIYVPNVTAPAPEVVERARFAKKAAAGGLLLSPGLNGFDTMRALAEDPRVDLPIISHPALLGSMVTCQDNGFSHAALFGQLQRLAGADASVFPNYGGRFGFTRDECEEISVACRAPMGPYRTIFPTPGGGMSLERVPDMLELYGDDVLFLVGGSLYARSPDLVDNARYFLSLVGR